MRHGILAGGRLRLVSRFLHKTKVTTYRRPHLPGQLYERSSLRQPVRPRNAIPQTPRADPTRESVFRSKSHTPFTPRRPSPQGIPYWRLRLRRGGLTFPTVCPAGGGFSVTASPGPAVVTERGASPMRKRERRRRPAPLCRAVRRSGRSRRRCRRTSDRR
jgi:hypothetical protein